LQPISAPFMSGEISDLHVAGASGVMGSSGNRCIGRDTGWGGCFEL
jgi:hypothetical protein